LEALAQEGDVLIALSTSGSSENIVKAIQTAKDLKVISVLFTSIKYSGSDADYILRVACTETDKIQPVHTAMGHIFCDLIEQGLRET
jgi:D-sedoheptulose 7-phosphate isomerase